MTFTVDAHAGIPHIPGGSAYGKMKWRHLALSLSAGLRQ